MSHRGQHKQTDQREPTMTVVGTDGNASGLRQTREESVWKSAWSWRAAVVCHGAALSWPLSPKGTQMNR